MRTFDVLDGCSPTMIKFKILLQCMREAKVDQDEPIPATIQLSWLKQRRELPALHNYLILWCYFPKEVDITTYQFHKFSDASEATYTGAVSIKLTVLGPTFTIPKGVRIAFLQTPQSSRGLKSLLLNGGYNSASQDPSIP